MFLVIARLIIMTHLSSINVMINRNDPSSNASVNEAEICGTGGKKT